MTWCTWPLGHTHIQIRVKRLASDFPLQTPTSSLIETAPLRPFLPHHFPVYWLRILIIILQEGFPLLYCTVRHRSDCWEQETILALVNQQFLISEFRSLNLNTFWEIFDKKKYANLSELLKKIFDFMQTHNMSHNSWTSGIYVNVHRAKCLLLSFEPLWKLTVHRAAEILVYLMYLTNTVFYVIYWPYKYNSNLITKLHRK